MRSEGSRGANLGRVVAAEAAPLPDQRPCRFHVPATGPRGSGTDPARPELAFLPRQPVTRPPPPGRGGTRCRPPGGGAARSESLRASATLARRTPRRFATSSPQRFRAENLPALVSMTFAASYKAVRTIASPALLMPPLTSVSPD